MFTTYHVHSLVAIYVHDHYLSACNYGKFRACAVEYVQRGKQSCKPEAMALPLEDAFRQFCSFGDKDSAPLMDGAKFAKMCRDCKLLDKTKLTPTDVDIIFAKAKP